MVSRGSATRVVILGTGGMGREALWIARAHNESGAGPPLDVAGFVTSNLLDHGTQIGGVPVLGDETILRDSPDLRVICAIGDPRGRRRTCVRLARADVRCATLVHPSAIIAEDVIIGEGSIISAGVIMTTGVRVGRNVIVNIMTSLSHDVCLEEFATLAPRVSLPGYVRIGEAADLGAAATVLPKISIGRGAVVGAGAVVTRDVEDNWVAMGVPARPTRKLPDHQWI